MLVFLLLAFAVATVPAASTPVRLENIRYYSYPEYTRVVLDLSSPIRIHEKKLKEIGRERLFFDLSPCVLASEYPPVKKNEIKIEAGNLKQIRIGNWNRNSIRVVFDFDKIGRYNRFYLTTPYRIVFDIYSRVEFLTRSQEAKGLPPPLPPLPGHPSMARQLGLGVHRIIIDPGHGGRDPGTINRQLKIEEKEVTLDVARRLAALLAEHSDLEVILTRSQDSTITLEERTAIANSSRGDLFVSIHANSAPRKSARGVETYFLNITTDPWAMSVAAQENAMSTKSISEMKSILDQILKSTNISESKVLAGFLQQEMVDNLERKYDRIIDLGVKKAPFYVLIGAQMPSSLIELSFLSQRHEAERMATPTYRHALAGGLYFGIIHFIESLGKNETFVPEPAS